MSKKNSIKKAAAVMLGLALTVGATGCDFIKTDNAKDLAQTVATVNIASSIAREEGRTATAKGLNQIIDLGGLDTAIPKRDLVSYFMNYGYTYVQSYGYTYSETFEMLLDMLVSRKIVTQYAVAYYLEKGLSASDCKDFIDGQLAKTTLSAKEKELLAAHPEVSALIYFLTEGGSKMELYDKALYQMHSSINSSLDSAEESYILSSEEQHSHGETRTTPTSVDMEKEDFYIAPYVDENGEISRYEVYTGLEKNGVPYKYEPLDGSTVTTRIKAYNAFIGNLDDNGLIKKGDNTAVFTEMDYYYVELASRLEQALITKYTDDLIALGEGELSEGYLAKRYKDTFDAQKIAYDANTSTFETAIGSISDTNFVTYSPVANYGFVYNILIPFSEEQNRLYAAEEARSTSDAELYAYRAQLLNSVKAKDLRDSWFSEHDHANYAFDAKAAKVEYYQNGGSNYIFFEKNLKDNERYEKLDVYLGQYPFNGTVKTPEETKNGKYQLKATSMNIKQFLGEMESYLEYAVEGENSVKDKKEWTTTYVTDAKDYAVNDKGEFTNYEQFIYYSGKVDVGTVTAANYFDPTTKGYQAAAAFNELMFAYSTDTGCLNTYMGYVVSPYTTSYVPEFEYAAQWAVQKGAGTYVVCPSTYGWHIIYVTYVYGQGDVYGNGNGYEAYDEDEAKKEGTFSYLYAEALKEQYSADYANNEQTRLILKFDNGDCVNRIQKTYQDLLDLDK